MLTGAFATHPLPKKDQFAAWRDWYGSVYETEPGDPDAQGFEAASANWTLGGFTVSQDHSQAHAVARSKSFIRRNAVDHWAVTVSKNADREITVRDERFRVRAGVPFILSLGEEMHINQPQADSRLRLLLSRDAFGDLAQLLDAVAGRPLDTPQGTFLVEFLLLLKDNLSSLTLEDASQLRNAIKATLEFCLAPSADRSERTDRPANATIMARVRRAVTEHLCSPALGIEKLCREAAISRSQLYRVLELEGGVARYIQRSRLSKSLSILCDSSNVIPINRIAEMFCFADSSTFSRLFRREFGVSPKEVRALSLSGLTFVPLPAKHDVHSFRDCLRFF